MEGTCGTRNSQIQCVVLEGTELGVLFPCVTCQEQRLKQVVHRSDTCPLLQREQTLLEERLLSSAVGWVTGVQEPVWAQPLHVHLGEFTTYSTGGTLVWRLDCVVCSGSRKGSRMLSTSPRTYAARESRPCALTKRVCSDVLELCCCV